MVVFRFRLRIGLGFKWFEVLVEIVFGDFSLLVGIWEFFLYDEGIVLGGRYYCWV